jgi:hypothetical protein
MFYILELGVYVELEFLEYLVRRVVIGIVINAYWVIKPYEIMNVGSFSLFYSNYFIVFFFN